jgi:hypothetical protein
MNIEQWLAGFLDHKNINKLLKAHHEDGEDGE